MRKILCFRKNRVLPITTTSHAYITIFPITLSNLNQLVISLKIVYFISEFNFADVFGSAQKIIFNIQIYFFPQQNK